MKAFGRLLADVIAIPAMGKRGSMKCLRQVTCSTALDQHAWDKMGILEWLGGLAQPLFHPQGTRADLSSNKNITAQQHGVGHLQ